MLIDRLSREHLNTIKHLTPTISLTCHNRNEISARNFEWNDLLNKITSKILSILKLLFLNLYIQLYVEENISIEFFSITFELVVNF